MVYQNSNFKIGLSLFGCAEKYTEQSTHCALGNIVQNGLSVTPNSSSSCFVSLAPLWLIETQCLCSRRPLQCSRAILTKWAVLAQSGLLQPSQTPPHSHSRIHHRHNDYHHHNCQRNQHRNHYRHHLVSTFSEDTSLQLSTSSSSRSPTFQPGEDTGYMIKGGDVKMAHSHH